ncbi:MAG: TMEM165/GDT1 family protein [Gammaproteobacteria bacterium]|nr:TMEM165/GDT1 family protein [Gammaproteobacteria bacterium]
MDHLINTLSNWDWLDAITASSSSFLLIFAAEIGDKSQLVCMALAARYRASPVMLGSALAFFLLNTLAVVFGAAIANWLPELYIFVVVAILFSVFGVHALHIKEDNNNEAAEIRTDRSILIGTFLLITVAEFGDKTQLAVVALSSTSLPIAVWFGSTVALITTSALGVWAGRTILQRVPIALLHRISGMIFISLAVFAAYKAYLAF